MGDISRHRDIYFHTREVTPADLLARCNLSRNELTYLELGNYLTDVSQFRDPVTYIFAKQRIWRDFILPKVRDKTAALRILSALGASASIAAAEAVKKFTTGDVAKYGPYVGAVLGGAGALIAAMPTDILADIGGADEWIDKMFGTPFERTIGDLKKRDDKHYGYVGQFFRLFIEGVTHWIFAQDVTEKLKGAWGGIDRISPGSLTAIYKEFFTQYYPHEHTDQPPYVWDASERPRDRRYQPSKRQRTLLDKDIGVMNAVDQDYAQYLSEGLADLEQEWRKIKRDDIDGRRRMLVRMGKLLHGIEDWYFHSNVVELIRLRGHKPEQGATESGEDFLKRFVGEISNQHPEFKTAVATERLRLKRRLYRRLRFPVYSRGNRKNSAGIVSETTSNLSLHFAYPAFPSQQDTAHTLLHALENIERKTHGAGPPELDPWMLCVFLKLHSEAGGAGDRLVEQKAAARGTTKAAVLAGRAPGATGPARDRSDLVITDVMREWLPLVVTLIMENERQRLVANVEPLRWPIRGGAAAGLKGPPGNKETKEQLDRHKRALQPQKHADGLTENSYERAARHLFDCGFINVSGQHALAAAFALDQESQKRLEGAPGAGGFLIQFSLELQRTLDEGDAATNELNNKSVLFDARSNNGAFNEIIGSHSLMSKDTLTSPPFFDDARVLASVASSSVFQIMLEQVSKPAGEPRLPWKAVLHRLIRFPPTTAEWERLALEFFKNNKSIPRFGDLPELAQLVERALQSQEALKPWSKGAKDDALKNEYIKLESKLSKYRYDLY